MSYLYDVRTLGTKPNTTPPVKKSRWKLKAGKDSKSAKKQAEESLVKKKKKLSFDKENGEQELINFKPESTVTASPKRIIKNDLSDADSASMSSPFHEGFEEHKAPSRNSFTASICAPSSDQLLTSSLDHFTDEVRKPFILLSQVVRIFIKQWSQCLETVKGPYFSNVK